MTAAMRVRSVVSVGLDEQVLDILTQAVRALSPRARVSKVLSLDEALQASGAPGREVLVLGDPSDADLARAVGAVSEDRLPRWPVLVLGPGLAADSTWFVPATDWNTPALEKVLRVAVSQHALIREADRSRGDLLTISRRMSHEMRSPLGCILTTAELMREEAESGSPASASIRSVVDSGNELLEIVDRFTFLVRASARPAESAAVDMGMAVWAALQRLEPEIRDSGAVISEPETWPRVSGVAEWLERIWLELLTNVLRHAGSNPRIELMAEGEEDEWRFSICDSGAGVPAVQTEALFLHFHRLHEKASGRGFGLALIQRLVDLQGGRCGYEVTSEGGACFFFTLPRG